MSDQPEIEDRAAVPYAGVTERVTMTTFAKLADRLPGLIGDLAAAGHPPLGAPFFRYLVIDMERELQVEAGVPVADPAAAAAALGGDVRAGEIPAGRYAVVLHTGPFDGLVDATARLLAWADERGLRWDVEPSPDGDRWGARLETYLDDPREVSDPSELRTELAFRLTG